MQANIKHSRSDLLAMSKHVASWRAFNEAAAEHLKTALKWEGAEIAKMKKLARQAPG
jgi:hypothetical protein